jgi:hypothetical protein
MGSWRTFHASICSAGKPASVSAKSYCSVLLYNTTLFDGHDVNRSSDARQHIKTGPIEEHQERGRSEEREKRTRVPATTALNASSAVMSCLKMTFKSCTNYIQQPAQDEN